MPFLTTEGLVSTRRFPSLSWRDDRSSEGVLYMPDLRPTRVQQEDADDVEAHLVEARDEVLSPLREVLLGYEPYPGLLSGCHGLQRIPIFQPPPQLDLDEDQNLLAPHDQVDLAVARPVVALQRLVPFSFEVSQG